MMYIITRLFKEIVIVFSLTYQPLFWRKISINLKYWREMTKNGYLVWRKVNEKENISIETVFFLFGDINVHVNPGKDEDLFNRMVKEQISELHQFTIQVLYFIPVLINLIVHLLIIAGIFIQCLRFFISL